MSRKFSRRDFLNHSFRVAAAGAFCSALPAVRAGTNGTLGVMIVGCGSRGSGSHKNQFLHHPLTEIRAVSDLDVPRAEKVADEIKEATGKRPKVVVDFREALSDPSIDIVTCAVSNHWHALCGVLAMQAGKDVYIEKPICHNIMEGQSLIAAAKKYGRCCQVGSQCRSNPAVQQSFAYISSGKLGEVKLVRSLCYKRRPAIGPRGLYPVPKEIDYNLWSGPAPIVDPMTRPQFHYDWHWQRLYGNGDLGNMGPHQNDIARSFLGQEEFPVSVITYGGRLGYQAEMGDDNYVDAGDTANTEIVICNYRDGKNLVIEDRGLKSPKLLGLDIGIIAYGSEGILVQHNYDSAFVYNLDGEEIERFDGADEEIHFSNFIECAANGTPEKLNADARVGHLAAGLCHLGNISYYLGEQNYVSPNEAKRILADVPGEDDHVETLRRTLTHLVKNGVDLKKTPISMGVPLKFDPDTETFIGNADADKMLTREYRGEFTVPKPADV